MSNGFKKSGKLSYLPQYNTDNRKSEAPSIEVKKSPQKKPYKIDKSKVVSLLFKAIYFVMLVVTLVALYNATNGAFLLTESYSEIHDSLQIASGSAIMFIFALLLERLVSYYVENFTN